MAVQERLFTAQDLWNMPDDGKIYELHNGVLIEVAGSQKRQTRLAAWIIYLITLFIEENNLGGAVSGADGTYELNLYNTRIPDVAYVTAEHDQQGGDGFYRGAPDLAVEVVSPSNTPDELQQRAGEYLAAGTSLIWIVYSEQRTVDVYLPGGERIVLSQSDQYLEGYEILPGLKLPLHRVFERIK
jgi:Uma2 family endonuclease